MLTERPRLESKDEPAALSLTLAIDTGEKELNEFFEAGVNYINRAHEKWRKGIVHKIKSEYEESRSLSSGARIVSFEAYINHDKNGILDLFKNNEGWSDRRKYIFGEIAQYTYLQHIHDYAKEYAREDATPARKKELAGLLNFYIIKYQIYLNSPYALRALKPEDREKDYKRVEGILSRLQEEQEFPAEKTRLVCEERWFRAEEILKRAFSLLDDTQAKWAKLGLYPLLRSSLLVVVAEMMKEMLKISSFAKKPGIRPQLEQELQKIAATLLLQEELYMDHQMQLIQEEDDDDLDDRERAELKNDKERARAFCEKPIDLVLHLHYQLYHSLAPTLFFRSSQKTNPYSYLARIDCSRAKWLECDSDIRNLFRELAMQEDIDLREAAEKKQAEEKSAAKNPDDSKSGVWRYLDYMPKDVSLAAQSEYRRQFIREFGAADAKEAVKKFQYINSSEEKVANVVRLFHRLPKRVAVIREEILDILDVDYRICMLTRERFAEAENVFDVTYLLSDDGMPWLKKLALQNVLRDIVIKEKLADEKTSHKQAFSTLEKAFKERTLKDDVISRIEKAAKERVQEDALDLHLLHRIFLQPADSQSWFIILDRCEKYPTGVFSGCISLLLGTLRKMQKEDAAFDESNSPARVAERSRMSIRVFLSSQYKEFEVTTFRSPLGLPPSLKQYPHAKALYGIYHYPNNQESWQEALNAKLIEGRASRRYLDLMKELVMLYAPEELQEQCKNYWRVCLAIYDKLILEEHLAQMAKVRFNVMKIRHQHDQAESALKDEKLAMESSGESKEAAAYTQARGLISRYLCSILFDEHIRHQRLVEKLGLGKRWDSLTDFERIQKNLSADLVSVFKKSVARYLAIEALDEHQSDNTTDVIRTAIQGFERLPELAALKNIYHHPEMEENWHRALDVNLFNSGANEVYLKVIRQLIMLCAPSAYGFRSHCLEDWRKCRDESERFAFVQDTLDKFYRQQDAARARFASLVDHPATFQNTFRKP